ncbi:hypothetical protein KA078_02125 [Candidatus Woesebacteria bacterium]|nr:hypothetical protein [Candidatus Woesebacteria bacterium]
MHTGLVGMGALIVEHILRRVIIHAPEPQNQDPLTLEYLVATGILGVVVTMIVVRVNKVELMTVVTNNIKDAQITLDVQLVTHRYLSIKLDGYNVAAYAMVYKKNMRVAAFMILGPAMSMLPLVHKVHQLAQILQQHHVAALK